MVMMTRVSRHEKKKKKKKKKDGETVVAAGTPDAPGSLSTAKDL